MPRKWTTKIPAEKLARASKRGGQSTAKLVREGKVLVPSPASPWRDGQRLPPEIKSRAARRGGKIVSQLVKDGLVVTRLKAPYALASIAKKKALGL